MKQRLLLITALFVATNVYAGFERGSHSSEERLKKTIICNVTGQIDEKEIDQRVSLSASLSATVIPNYVSIRDDVLLHTYTSEKGVLWDVKLRLYLGKNGNKSTLNTPKVELVAVEGDGRVTATLTGVPLMEGKTTQLFYRSMPGSFLNFIHAKCKDLNDVADLD